MRFAWLYAILVVTLSKILWKKCFRRTIKSETQRRNPLFIIFDVVIVAVILLFALIGLRRGFIKSLAGLIGAVIAMALALTIAHFAADWIYDALIAKPVENAVNEALSAGGASAAGVISALPAGLSGIVKSFGGEAAVEQAVSQSSSAASSMILGILRPALVNLTMILLALLLFIPMMILVRLLLRLLNGVVNNTPVVKHVNRILGILFGFCKGIIVVWLLCLLADYALPLTGNVWWHETAHQSWLFHLFSQINPLSLWMQGIG